MLSQLQFKLNVEEQYKDGIEKIMGSYAMEGDRKIRQEAQGRRVESMQKIQLLSRALKRYKDLHVDMETDLTDGKFRKGCEVRRYVIDIVPDDSTNAPNLRKPLSGLLSLRIHAVSDVNHAATSRLSRGPETFVIMKVEDEFKGRTRATRTDKWTDELHEIDINRGNEIELTVYDKAGGDHPLPIGMLWIRITDIAEEMRRKKIETEFNNSGWVSADQTVGGGRPTNPQMQFSAPPGHQSAAPSGPMGPPFGDGAGASGAGQPQMGPVVIDAWFSLEPVGRIQLAMSFGKTNPETWIIYFQHANLEQPSKQPKRSLSTPASIAEEPYDSARKTSMNCMATSSWPNRFIISCAAPSVESFSSTPPACSVRIASICVTKSATQKSSQNVSASPTQRATRMRPN